jgi:hypothetical protein
MQPTTNSPLGPGALATPSVPKGRPFSLSAPEWLAVQTYVVDALALPTTDDAFRASLGEGAPTDLAPFRKLIDCYVGINAHCTTWQKKTFPASVALASDINFYGTKKAPVYYAAIQKEADILIDNPDDEKAKAALKAILDNLSAQAQTYATNAEQVAKEIQDFADKTQADKTILVGPDGQGGLVKEYNDKYGSTSAEVRELTKQMADLLAILDQATKDYNYDVTVASTTPTYAWVIPFGLIAAAIVAGIYGKRATEALDLMRASQQKISELNAKLAADANLLNAIHGAQIGMNRISNELAAALPIIQKIQGVWGAIQRDLQNIVQLIDSDIREALPLIMNLGIAEAIKAWKDVADEADEYRVHAYIIVDGVSTKPAAEAIAA